jgi:hypothetical protein
LPEPTLIEVSDAQYSTKPPPIDMTLLEMVMEVRAVHDWKA